MFSLSEPQNGGIKISSIIQRFEGAFEKTAGFRPSNINSLAVASK
jgi:hypothetical protein